MEVGRRVRRAWGLERVLFAMAGAMTLASVLLARLVSPWFLLLTAFTGLNQLVFVLLGDCPASLVLRRCGFREGGRDDAPVTDAGAATSDPGFTMGA